MMKPPEAVGSMPQPAVNPQAQGPQGAPMAPQGASLPPDQIAALRKDPDIARAIEMVMGRKVDMMRVPENLLVNAAGMVHKLGVEGAVKEFMSKLPPQALQQLRAGRM